MAKMIEKVKFLPKQPQALRVAAYARVSSGKDAMLNSLSAQISYYNEYIQNHSDWLYCGVYSDAAKTGTKENREGFQRLLAACRAGQVDMVVMTLYPKIKKWFLKKYPEVEKFGIEESDNEVANETGAKYEAVMAPLVKSNPVDSELAFAG